MSNAKAPHIAILHINIEIQELLPSGECSGKPIDPSKISDLKRNFIISVKGFDRQDCINKLKEKLNIL